MADTLRILYVDDEPSLLGIAKAFLEKTGNYSITTLESATVALERLKLEQYDAIISDYQMPDMNGIEFLKSVRKSGNSSPFIIFTGRGREEVVVDAINNGVDFYLQKGGDPRAQFAELSHKIYQAVARCRAQEELRAAYEQLAASNEELHQQYQELSESERRIRQSESNFQSLVEAAADAVYISQDEKFVYVNPAMVQLMGASSADQLLGMSLYDRIHPSYLDEIRARAQMILNDRKPADLKEAVYIRMDGTPVPIESTVAPIQFKNKFAGLLILRDITRRKITEEKLRESEKWYRVVFETTGSATVLIEEDDTLILVNSEFVRLSGYQKEEIENKKKWTEFVVPEDLQKLRTQRTLRMQDPAKALRQYEFRFISRSGETFNIYATLDIIPGTRKIIASLTDITNRIRSENLVKSSLERLDTLVSNLPAGVMMVSAENIVEQVNQTLCDIYGLEDTPESLRGLSSWEMVGKILDAYLAPGEVRDRIQEFISRGKKINDHEIFLRNGRIVSVDYIPLYDHEGRWRGRLWFHKDITYRKKTEEQLRESEERFRRILSRTFDAIVVHQDGNIVVANEAAARLMGAASVADLVGRPILDLVHPDYRSIVSKRVRDMTENLDGTVPLIEEKFIRFDGKLIIAQVMATTTVHNGKKAIMVVLRDVTPQKEADEEIFQSRQMLQLVMDSIPERVFWKDRNSVYLGCNLPLAIDAGYDRPGDLIGKDDFATASRDMAERYRADDRMVMEKGQPKLNYEEPQTKPDGSLAWLSTSKIPLRDKDGEVIGVLGTYEDITERKQMEQALKESEAKYRMIIENMQDMFYRTDKEGTFTMVSPGGARLLGYESPDQILGKSATEFYPEPENRKELLDQIHEKDSVYGYPLDIKSRDGHVYHVLVSSHQYHDENGEVQGVEGVVHDVTDLRKAEEGLRMANKKLNLLAGITRHDIRNQLMALEGYLDLSKSSTGDAQKISEYIGQAAKIAQAIDRQISFTQLYQDLGVQAPSWQSVHVAVRSAMSELALGPVQVDTGPEDLELYADPLLGRVFYNLIDNALRYGGETLTAIRVSASPLDRTLLLVVEDDGAGISVHDKPRLFTRGFGKNTGLGLFLSREILSITNISISETGEPGHGARFEMTVPHGNYRYAKKTS